MTKIKTDLITAVNSFDVRSREFIVASSLPSGHPSLLYRGDRKQLTLLFRLIRDTLREKERIGNHPNRGDVRPEETRSRDG